MKPFDLLAAQLLNFLPNIISGLITAIIFFIIWLIAKQAINHLTKHFTSEKEYLAQIISKIVNLAIITIGFVTTLDIVGINIGGLIAGLGLTGFAIGFALKDILSNIASGILLLIYKPFIVGDTIEAMGVKGEVINLDIRYTTLKSGKEINLIPNSKLLTEKIIIKLKK